MALLQVGRAAGGLQLVDPKCQFTKGSADQEAAAVGLEVLNVTTWKSNKEPSDQGWQGHPQS